MLRCISVYVFIIIGFQNIGQNLNFYPFVQTDEDLLNLTAEKFGFSDTICMFDYLYSQLQFVLLSQSRIVNGQGVWIHTECPSTFPMFPRCREFVRATDSLTIWKWNFGISECEIREILVYQSVKSECEIRV